MGRVIVAPAHHRSHAQGDRLLGFPDEHPSDCHQVAVAHAEDFLLHDRAVAVIGPGRPGVCREARALFVSFRVNGVGVEIGRERIGLAFDVDPCFEVIHEDKPFTRRLARRQQQRMVAACVRARDCAGREPTATVGLQPLKAKGSIEILALFFLNLHYYALSSAVRIGWSYTARVQRGPSPDLTRPPSQRRDASFPDRPRVARARKPPNLCPLLP